MKKLLSTLILFSLLLGYACSDSEKDEPKPPPFVWNGDWNDPADPNYKPEGYNPVKGLWRILREGDTFGKVGIYYSDDLEVSAARFNDNGTHTIEGTMEYIINNTAYKRGVNNTYPYKIEGDILTISYGGQTPDSRFRRVEEK